MKWAAMFLAASALTICKPAVACNSEGWELPWDFQKADKVVVGRIRNYRLVPNEAEGARLKQAIESGMATIYQKQRYEENLVRGLPPGGKYGIFDLAVNEVLKGKSARRITVIFPYDEWANQPPGDHSMLPASLPNQDAIIGLRTQRTSYYGDLNLPRVVTNSCEGIMIQYLNDKHRAVLLQGTRRYLGSKRRH
jgi:hypothetical protein